jgi:hypothetical protein
VLQTWLDGPPDERVELQVLHWNARREVLVSELRRSPRSLLRGQVARVLGALPAADRPPDAPSAERLVALLSDAVRQSRPD